MASATQKYISEAVRSRTARIGLSEIWPARGLPKFLAALPGIRAARVQFLKVSRKALVPILDFCFFEVKLTP